jgi:hypothetical protein
MPRQRLFLEQSKKNRPSVIPQQKSIRVRMLDGTTCLYQCRLHSIGNDPAISRPTGERLWYQNGQLHREDGPAKINREGIFYYQQNELHREDGPAIIMFDGREHFFLNGTLVDSLESDTV